MLRHGKHLTKKNQNATGQHYISLNGRARETVRGISINDVKKNDGIEEIIKILDEIF